MLKEFWGIDLFFKFRIPPDKRELYSPITNTRRKFSPVKRRNANQPKNIMVHKALIPNNIYPKIEINSFNSPLAQLLRI